MLFIVISLAEVIFDQHTGETSVPATKQNFMRRENDLKHVLIQLPLIQITGLAARYMSLCDYLINL